MQHGERDEACSYIAGTYLEYKSEKDHFLSSDTIGLSIEGKKVIDKFGDSISDKSRGLFLLSEVWSR